jgi:hypothetical protein
MSNKICYWDPISKSQKERDETEVEQQGLQALIEREAAVAYRSQRLSEYPTIADQLDALWKGGEHAAEMSSLIQNIKLKYPKPQ